MRNLTLHGYWRSSAAYRVRIALNLKGVTYTQVNHDLRVGAQRAQAYRMLAPHGLVPALEHDETVLIESPAILEWIEEQWFAPALLPGDADQRAVVRAMAALIGCDIHPLNNLRVLNEIRVRFQADEVQVRAWIHRWIVDGFTALEALIGVHGGLYAFGDSPTLADCYLAPQLYSARRFDVDLKDYPLLVAAGDAAARLPAFVAAHPDRQPDADV